MTQNSKPVVMITGAARGFGQDLARQFRASGYQISATARTPPMNTEPEDVWQALDVTIYDQCVAAIAEGFYRFGRIDVLVNNASGYTGGTTISDVPVGDIDAELNITLRGPIYLSKLFVDHARIQKSGKIIFISSVAGLAGEPDCALYSVYSAAKAGLIRFAECLQGDIETFGMQVLVVVPGSMRSLDEQPNLPTQRATAYDAVARFVVNIAAQSNNLLVSHVVLRPALAQVTGKDNGL